LLHFFASDRILVIVSADVKKSVNDVTDYLALPRRAVSRGLAGCFFDANKNVRYECRLRPFASPVAAIIEGNHVGGAGVAKVLFVQSRDGLVTDKIHSEDIFLSMQIVAERRADNTAQVPSIYEAGTLLVLDVKFRLHP
jgi:hypothetical protein